MLEVWILHCAPTRHSPSMGGWICSKYDYIVCDVHLPVQVSIGDEELEQTLEAKNTGDKPFELTAALHTYIAVSSIDKVTHPITAAPCRRSLLGHLPCRACVNHRQSPLPLEQHVPVT